MKDEGCMAANGDEASIIAVCRKIRRMVILFLTASLCNQLIPIEQCSTAGNCCRKFQLLTWAKGSERNCNCCTGYTAMRGKGVKLLQPGTEAICKKRREAVGWWESYWNVLYIEAFRDRRVAGMGASFSVFKLGGGGLILIPGGRGC